MEEKDEAGRVLRELQSPKVMHVYAMDDKYNAGNAVKECRMERKAFRVLRVECALNSRFASSAPDRIPRIPRLLDM